MLEGMLRALGAIAPGATWFLLFFAAIVAVFVLYVGIALFATLRASDEQQQKVRHELFRDLLGLFRYRNER